MLHPERDLTSRPQGQAGICQPMRKGIPKSQDLEYQKISELGIWQAHTGNCTELGWEGKLRPVMNNQVCQHQRLDFIL